MAHYLLKKNDAVDEEIPHVLDVCKQVDSLDITYRRKAFRALMIEQALMLELNQDKILRFSSLMMQPREPSCLENEKEMKGYWKSIPRKKILIGSVDKMLSMPDRFPLLDNNNIGAVDWSCNDMIAIAVCDYLNVYNNDGEQLLTYKVDYYDSNKIIAVKWNNDGNKIMLSVFIPVEKASLLIAYDFKKQKVSWNVKCSCIWESINKIGCIVHCLCWAAYDHQIITGCAGKISVYDSTTGKSIRSSREFESDVLILSLSPNSEYLVSVMKNKIVRVSTWPELVPYFDIIFFKPATAIAWHPQVSNLLCIGGVMSGCLSLWNISKRTMIDFVHTKFNGRVKNLAWNKLSGELVVHWTYKEGENRYDVVAVLASFNQIIDVLPLDKETRLFFLMFNATHEQLITICNSNVCSVWNFFGNDKSFKKRRMIYNSARQKQETLIHNPIR